MAGAVEVEKPGRLERFRAWGYGKVHPSLSYARKVVEGGEKLRNLMPTTLISNDTKKATRPITNWQGKETELAAKPDLLPDLKSLEELESEAKKLIADYRNEVETILGRENRGKFPQERTRDLNELNTNFEKKMDEILVQQEDPLKKLLKDGDDETDADAQTAYNKLKGEQGTAINEMTAAAVREMQMQAWQRTLPSGYTIERSKKNADGTTVAIEGPPITPLEPLEEGETRLFSSEDKKSVIRVSYNKGVIDVKMNGLQRLKGKERDDYIDAFVASSIATTNKNPVTEFKITEGNTEDMLKAYDRLMGGEQKKKLRGIIKKGGGRAAINSPLALITKEDWLGSDKIASKDEPAALKAMDAMNIRITKFNKQLEKTPAKEGTVATPRIAPTPAPPSSGA